MPDNRNDRKAWELSGARDAVGHTAVIADGGYRGTGLVIPHRRERGQAELILSAPLDASWLAACRDQLATRLHTGGDARRR